MGEKRSYDGALSMNSVDFFGLGCISMVITKPPLGKLGTAVSKAEPPKDEGYEIISETRKNGYKKFVLKEKRIVGMVLVGDIRPAGVISVLIKKKIDVSSIKEILLDDNFSYAKILALVKKHHKEFEAEEFQDTVITYQ